MDWLNLHTSVLDSQEFLGAEPTVRATWLCLLRYCVGQENSGVIPSSKAWGDRRWQQVCRVTLAEVQQASELWSWDGDDLRVSFYPSDKQAEVQAKRGAGKLTATKRWAKQGSLANSSAISSAHTEGKGREGKEKGREAEQPSPFFDGMDADETPVEIAAPIPMEINWRDWRSHHGQVHVAFRGEDGCADDWERIFGRYGVQCLDAMYSRLLEEMPGKRIYYSAALTWLETNTRKRHAQ